MDAEAEGLSFLGCVAQKPDAGGDDDDDEGEVDELFDRHD